jgi:hypothetical protein
LLRQVAILLLDRGGPACDRRPSRWKRWGIFLTAVGIVAAAVLLLVEGQVLLAAACLIPGVLAGLALAREVRRQLAWARKDAIRSPLPRHADALLARLLGSRQPYQTVQQALADFEATADRPAQVTSWIRLAHLATLGTCLAPCLLIMFVTSRIVHAVMVETVLPSVLASEKMVAVLNRGQFAEYVRAHMGKTSILKLRMGSPPLTYNLQLDRDSLINQFSNPGAREQAERRLAQQRSYLQGQVEGLNFVDRLWLGADLEKAEELLRPGRTVEVRDFGDFLGAAILTLGDHAGQEAEDVVFWMLVAILLIPPLCWVAWAELWRGGLTYRLLGLALVRGSGQPASRWQCAWRAFVVWGTVTPLLFLAMWLDEYYPQQGRWSWLSWGAGLLLLLAFAGLALRWPARALHDWLAGTYLVPQ